MGSESFPSGDDKKGEDLGLKRVEIPRPEIFEDLGSLEDKDIQSLRDELRKAEERVEAIKEILSLSDQEKNRHIRKAVSEASSFSDLYEIARKYDLENGPKGESANERVISSCDPDKYPDILSVIETNDLPFTVITRDYGLREKVIELVRQRIK